MCGQLREPRREERAPAEITVPRLSREEAERRAGAGFDSALGALIRSQFSAPPPAAELNAIRRTVADMTRGRPDVIVDVAALLEEYASANPNSTVARYLQATGGSTEWITSGGRIAFNPRALADNMRSVFASMRSRYVTILGNLSDPSVRTQQLEVAQILAMAPASVPEMQRLLSAQLAAGRNALPATLTYESDSQRYLVATRLPVPEQNLDFSRGGKSGRAPRT